MKEWQKWIVATLTVVGCIVACILILFGAVYCFDIFVDDYEKITAPVWAGQVFLGFMMLACLVFLVIVAKMKIDEERY